MTPETPEPEPCYERFRLTYPSGTAVYACYGDGATVEEVRVTHPRAVVGSRRGFNFRIHS